MSPNGSRFWPNRLHHRLLSLLDRGAIPAAPLTILLACAIGILAGYGSILFTWLIDTVTDSTLRPPIWIAEHRDRFWGLVLLGAAPAAGLLVVSWMTRRFAPEAQGHGVPEVITAVARRDGLIRPRVAAIKILASGFCIGTGGSAGREGPIVQIGSSLGSVGGQLFKLSSRNIKVLVAAGAAAGISATFNAPIAGVIFAGEIILGSFAVESLTPIVIASVLADVVQKNYGEHGQNPAFTQLEYQYGGAWNQLPSYFLLGIACGLMAVAFTKLLYRTEDFALKWIPVWWLRSLGMGVLVGVLGVAYFLWPMPFPSQAMQQQNAEHGRSLPALYGVGYDVVDHALHLQNRAQPAQTGGEATRELEKMVRLDRGEMITMLCWLLPLALLKPLATSITLAGGGSGGIFAPSLFIGATLGGAFGLVCNLLLPEWSAHPGVYAIVGMGAVVAGTTHGILSAILIVYEMTDDYLIILPIMIAAGIASVIARVIDRESIYLKKLSRRGESLARGHEMSRLEDVKVRDVMIRDFPTVRETDNVAEIVRTARANPHIESLPVMNGAGRLVGIIRPEDLHRVLDSDIAPYMLFATDIALSSNIAISPQANLLEALRDFGTRDVETLPVETREGDRRRLVGLLLRSDVMSRYREEMLRR